MINWEKYYGEIKILYGKLKSYEKVSVALHERHPEYKHSASNTRYIGSLVSKFRKFGEILESSPAKVLIFDIETAPLRAYTWSKFQKGVSDQDIISRSFILTWSAKWLFEDEILSDRLTPKELDPVKKFKEGNDKRITKSLWKLLNEADVVIAHNLDKFDERVANTAFFRHDLKLPSSYTKVDTLKEARGRFRLESNRLDYIATRVLGIEGKKQTERGLWIRCMEGEYSALEYMDEYCQQDVRVLEDVYLALRPYMKRHPNLGLFINETNETCHKCGSSDLKKVGVRRTMLNEYDELRCEHCGSLNRRRSANTSIKGNPNLTTR